MGKQWNILELHEPGAAKLLVPEAANPGAESYFADSLMTDREGAPWMVARLKLCNPMNMHPWRHLRAALFWIERAAAKMKHPLQQWCYVVDIGEPNCRGTYGPTAGGQLSAEEEKLVATESRSARGANAEARYGARNDPSRYGAEDAERVEKELLETHGTIDAGLGVLKLAMQLIQAHYPDMLRKVFFANSDVGFFLVFKIFSLWVDSRTRAKFVFIGQNRFTDYPLETLQEYIPPDQIFVEYDGTGPSLDGDDYIRRAVEAYDGGEGDSAPADVKSVAGSSTEEVLQQGQQNLR